MNLTNKSCLITGGTKGIGAATAIALAEQGADIAIAARHEDDDAKSTLAQIRALGRRGVFIQADFAKPEGCRRAVEQTAGQLGSLDVLVHSAGGPVNGGLFEISDNDWYGAFNVHVHAIYHLCRAAVPLMRPMREGAIILVSSSAGRRGIKTNIAYQVVKGALPQFTRALAYELANDNIRVNCVAPGVIRTAFHDKMTAETKKNNLENRIPLRREGTSEQVATLIRELITNDYITGETFPIDGGLTMRIC
jgi:NAD(P)-dependent dehydrogenase (short-subunit alcohol dehydrogenase family)